MNHGTLLFLLKLSGTLGQCSNTCNYASDGVCDDGGPGSETAIYPAICSLGTDCVDCGQRGTPDGCKPQLFKLDKVAMNVRTV